MKRPLLLTIVLGVGLFLLAGCGNQDGEKQAQDKPVDTTLTAPPVKPAAAIYYCPMDTDVVSDKPGKCPKCGMDLVEKPSENK